MAQGHPEGGYGLRREVLSPMETLAQSVSTIAPMTTPVATIPLVCALAGNGTWLAYVLATGAILLVAMCVGKFARYSASPGSLYTYTSMVLPPSLAAAAAWSLLLAYIATGSSVIGGFYHYGNLLLRDATGHGISAALLALVVTAISIWIAWRDVKISARLMLWIEAVSVSLILVVITLVLVRQGHHLDWQQFHLRGMSGLRLGLILALFSFVGFESATTLGSEARNPLRTIPRAVIQSALLAGAIFIACAYAEVLGLRSAGQDLGTSQAPMRVLARVGGLPLLGPLIDMGALVSMFAGTLACITAAARVLLLMSHNGLVHGSLRKTHARNETPGLAIFVMGAAAVLPVVILAALGSSGLDVYGWMGSLATYGFIVAYALVSLALPRYLREHNAYRPGAQIIPWLAFCAMPLALVGNLYPLVLERLPAGSREENVTLTTDNGTQFTSSRFPETLARLGITHRRTAYHHPEGNSYIERFHRSLKEEEVWTAEYRSLEEARASIARWIEEYNHDRPHRGVGNRTPHEAFLALAGVLKNEILTV